MILTGAMLMRSSAGAMVMGGAASAVFGLSYLLFRDLVNLALLIVALSMVTGFFAAPFVWWTARRRADLFLGSLEVSADEGGIGMTSAALGETRQPWSVYRRARETDRAFVLDTGAGVNVLIAKRDVPTDKIDRIRTLLAIAGLIRDPSPAIWPRQLLWLGVGAVVGLGFLFATVYFLPRPV